MEPICLLIEIAASVVRVLTNGQDNRGHDPDKGPETETGLWAARKQGRIMRLSWAPVDPFVRHSVFSKKLYLISMKIQIL